LEGKILIGGGLISANKFSVNESYNVHAALF
jgi:hypothetical protein